MVRARCGLVAGACVVAAHHQAHASMRRGAVAWLAALASLSRGCRAPSAELLRFMGGEPGGARQPQPAAAAAPPAAASGNAALRRFMQAGGGDAQQAPPPATEPAADDVAADEKAQYEQWAAKVNGGGARGSRGIPTSCGARVGCAACVTDKRCLWCPSPRQCVDAAAPAAELNRSCPLQPPRDSCLDFNLQREREAFIRPCARELGGTLRRHQRGCCGDGTCANARPVDGGALEDDQNCPADCTLEATAAKLLPQKLVETVDSATTVFGKLKEVVHDTYHCEDTFDKKPGAGVSSPCSDQGSAHRPSQWLEELVLRDKTLLHTSSAAEVATFQRYRRQQDRYRAGDTWYAQEARQARTKASSPFAAAMACRVDMSCSEWPELAFAMPRFGGLVVEFGAGLGQDTRNLATAGYNVLGVEVSAEASAEAKAISAKSLSAEALGRFEFLNYDALALPKPVRTIDFLADFTVYCGLRHRYLPRMYELWQRILTPGHTIVMVSCWKGEELPNGREPSVPVPIHREDMVLDFAPLFDTLHYESCMKNQETGGPDGAHCFWLKLKPESERNSSTTCATSDSCV